LTEAKSPEVWSCLGHRNMKQTVLQCEMQQNYYKWEDLFQIRSRTVAVPYFGVAATIRCDWTYENNEKPF
jgi:hypothetical protein